MLDINLIRNNPEEVKAKLAKKEFEVDFTEFLAQDKERRALMHETEELKAERNRVSAEIPKLKKAGEDTTAIFDRMREIGDKIKQNDAEIAKMQAEQDSFVASLPNLPADDVVAGGKENNEELYSFGQKPEFNFEPKDHVALEEALDLVDYMRGVRLGGSGFWLYKGDGARLEWALLNYFVDSHLADGYRMILPPHLLNYECGYTAGQFPKFENDVFTLQHRDGMGNPDQVAKEQQDEEASFKAHGFKRFLAPTSETALVNVHRGEILSEEELPLKYFAYTPCYRSEAGSYRAEERGTLRGYQFNKVEMFQYTKPEDSEAALQELIKKAEKLMQGLGLHYRVSKLAAADCSASMAKTYDIEVWLPSINDYKEVSSASNAMDYQARRGNIRYRKDGKKIAFVHTLNASGLATSRLFPAILEQFQQEDGSVIIPEVLRKYMGGQEVIKPVK